MYRYSVLLLVALTTLFATATFVSAFTTNPSTNEDSNPKTTCNNNNCILIWQRSTTPSFIEVFYQLIDHNGNPIGQETKLTNNGLVASTALAAGSDTFLISWSDSNTQTIQGKIIDKLGNQISLNTGTVPTAIGTLAAAYDSINNRYLIIHDYFDISALSTDLFVILVDTNGNQVVSRSRLFAASDYQIPTSLIFDGSHGNYILAYTNYTQNSQLRLTAIDTQGARSLAQGTQAPIDINIANISANLVGSILSYNSFDSSFLVVWGDPNTGQGDIRAQIVKPVFSIPSGKINALTPQGSIIGISTDPDMQTLHSVSFNQKDLKYIISWYANKLVSPGPGIYIQIQAASGAKSLSADTKLNVAAASFAESNIFFNNKISKYMVPVRTSQNKISLSYFDTNTAISNPGSFVAPKVIATKRFVPTDLFTNQTLADGSSRFNIIPVGFIDPVLGPRLIVDALFDKGDVNVGDISIEATDNATAVNLVTARNISQKHTLSVPNNNAGKGVRVCPLASQISDVKDNCVGEVELSTVPSNHSSGISLVFGKFKTQNDIYLVSGLNSTGVELLGNATQPAGPQTQAMVATNSRQINNSIEFQASYTYNNGTTIIQNPSCKISFGDIAGFFDMTYTPSLGGAINLYTRPFTATTSSTYTITCSQTGFTTETSAGNFSIQVAGVDSPPTDVSAESPIEGKQFLVTGDVEFICSAKDDHNLNTLKLTTTPAATEKTTQVTGIQNRTSWTIKNIAKGTYTWSCEAEDNSGQKVRSAQRSFTINFTSTVSPTGGATPSCQENWNCVPSDFSSITCSSNGVKTRNCIDLNNCNNQNPSIPKPDTQACIPAGGAVCREDWACTSVGSCVEGKQAVTCTDKNNCTNPTPVVEKPTKKSCGTATGSGDSLLSNPFILGLIAAIVVLVVVFVIIRKRKKSKPEEEEQQEEKYGDDGELRGGYEETPQEGEEEYKDENQDDQEGTDEEER